MVRVPEDIMQDLVMLDLDKVVAVTSMGNNQLRLEGCDALSIRVENTRKFEEWILNEKNNMAL